MKAIRLFIFLGVIVTSMQLQAQNNNVGIGTTTPHPSAALDISSSNQGILIPRVEPISVSNPAKGLMVFSNSDSLFYYYDGGSWNKIQHGADSLDHLLDVIADYNKRNFIFGDGGIQLSPMAERNLGIGTASLLYNTDGSYNVGIGHSSLTSNLTGWDNTAVGTHAMHTTETGNKNTAIGNEALFSLEDANRNVGIGANAGTYLIEGDSNTLVGYGAGAFNANFSSSGCVKIGYEAGALDTTNNKLFIDNSNTQNPLIWGDFDQDIVNITGQLKINNNYAFPLNDGYANGVLTTDGSGNLHWGYMLIIDSLKRLNDVSTNYNMGNMLLGNGNVTITTGTNNVSLGKNNFYRLTSGYMNTALGHESQYFTDTGYKNTSIGSASMRDNNGGHNNVALGSQALHNIDNGYGNVAIGSDAGMTMSNGDKNVLIGNNAGNYSSASHSMNGCIKIGFEAGRSDSTDNKLYIENSDSAFPLIYGDFLNDSIKINGTLSINDEYSFPKFDGVNNQQIVTNGNGDLVWMDVSTVDSLDNLGDVYADEINNNYFIGKNNPSITTGTGNLAIGLNALNSANTSIHNIAIGTLSQENTTTGNHNVSMGVFSMKDNVSGERNTAIGNQAMHSNKSGNRNAIFGSNAALNMIGGSDNTFLGCDAGNYSGSHTTIGCVKIGHRAGALDTLNHRLYIENTDSNEPLIYGDFANDTVKIFGTLNINNQYSFPKMDGMSNTTLVTDGNGELSWSSFSIVDSLGQLKDTHIDHSKENFILGHKGYSITTGTGNLSVGQESLWNVQSGEDNVAIGVLSQFSTSTGIRNVSVGHASMRYNSGGSRNVSLGFQSLINNSNGNDNVVIGNDACVLMQNGEKNVIIGSGAGTYNDFHSTSGCVKIGYDAGSQDTMDNRLYIQNSSYDEPLIYGDFAGDSLVFTGKVIINSTDNNDKDFYFSDHLNEPSLETTQANYGYIGNDGGHLYKIYSNYYYAGGASNYLTYSDQRIKENIKPLKDAKEKLLMLNPVSYDLKVDHYQKFENKIDPEKGRLDRRGFIAQELEEVYPNLVQDDESGLKAVSYQGLIPEMVAVIKDQQKQIDKLEEQITLLYKLLEQK